MIPPREMFLVQAEEEVEDEVEDEEPYTYEGCWDAWGQELQSLTPMEARTDKQTIITSWQMCAPCCYRRCTL